MSDGLSNSNPMGTLYRYIIGPGLAILLMTIVTLRCSGIDPKAWREEGEVFQTAPEGDEWQPYSRNRLAALREDRSQGVLVHVVADWADGSMAQRVALCSDPVIASHFSKGRLRPLLADDSQRPPDIATLLDEAKAEALPAVILYPAGGGPPLTFTGPNLLADLKAAVASPSK